ncbi:phosphoribosylanthranilate isomerase [Marinilabiliaceae bacterium JC017]|nr:phosphoribosylanthranilate isomerase [Marinilabiliaceae bacterium JC017]
MKVKVCGMRDAGNITRLTALKPDYIGFIFYPKSPRYIGKALTPQLMYSIPRNITKTGVFVNASTGEIAQAIADYRLDAVQLHGSESPEKCFLIKQFGVRVIKAFGVDETFDFQTTVRYQDYCDFFLFDTRTPEHGGSGHKFKWDILKKYNQYRPFFLSGGITLEDTEDISALSSINPYAVDINSRFETAPAVKDLSQVEAFITKIRSND